MAEEIPAYLNSEFFTKIVQQHLHTTSVRITRLHVSDRTVRGENYCSRIYKATGNYRLNGDENGDEHTFHWIVKSMPQSMQGVLLPLKIYSKESIFYMQIQPIMETLMWQKGFTEKWLLAARHIHSTIDPEESILLVDLTQEGFEQVDREIGLGLEHSQVVMKKLAEFHALSMTILQREPDLVKANYPHGLVNEMSIRSASFKMLFGGQLLKLAALIADDPAFTKIAKDLLKYYDEFADRVFKAVYPLQGHLNVLNHGDLWVNNIFFRFDDMHKKVQEVRLIDFQLCFHGSLGFDINYFLNTSVKVQVLREHRSELIALYSSTLVATLKKLPFDSEKITVEMIRTEIRQREAYGLFVAFSFMPIMSMVRAAAYSNSLENFHDEEFARRKLDATFMSNPRTMETLKYVLKRYYELNNV